MKGTTILLVTAAKKRELESHTHAKKRFWIPLHSLSHPISNAVQSKKKCPFKSLSHTHTHLSSTFSQNRVIKIAARSRIVRAGQFWSFRGRVFLSLIFPNRGFVQRSYEEEKRERIFEPEDDITPGEGTEKKKKKVMQQLVCCV